MATILSNQITQYIGLQSLTNLPHKNLYRNATRACIKTNVFVMDWKGKVTPKSCKFSKDKSKNSVSNDKNKNTLSVAVSKNLNAKEDNNKREGTEWSSKPSISDNNNLKDKGNGRKDKG